MPLFFLPLLTILATSAVATFATSAIKGPLDQVLSTAIPTGDAPLRQLMSAAASGTITIAEFQNSTAFRRLDPGDKSVILAYVTRKRRADADDSAAQLQRQSYMEAKKAIDVYDDEIYKPLTKDLDDVEDDVDDAIKQLRKLQQDETDNAVNVESGAFEAALNAFENRAIRAGVFG